MVIEKSRIPGYDPYVAYVAHIIGFVSIRGAANQKLEDLVEEGIAIGSHIDRRIVTV